MVNINYENLSSDVIKFNMNVLDENKLIYKVEKENEALQLLIDNYSTPLKKKGIYKITNKKNKLLRSNNQDELYQDKTMHQLATTILYHVSINDVNFFMTIKQREAELLSEKPKKGSNKNTFRQSSTFLRDGIDNTEAMNIMMNANKPSSIPKKTLNKLNLASVNKELEQSRYTTEVHTLNKPKKAIDNPSSRVKTIPLKELKVSPKKEVVNPFASKATQRTPENIRSISPKKTILSKKAPKDKKTFTRVFKDQISPSKNISTAFQRSPSEKEEVVNPLSKAKKSTLFQRSASEKEEVVNPFKNKPSLSKKSLIKPSKKSTIFQRSASEKEEVANPFLKNEEPKPTLFAQQRGSPTKRSVSPERPSIIEEKVANPFKQKEEPKPTLFAQQRGSPTKRSVSPERPSITQDEVINPFKQKEDIKPTVLTKQRSGEKKTLKPSKKSTIFQRSPGSNEKEEPKPTLFAQQRGSPTKRSVSPERPSIAQEEVVNPFKQKEDIKPTVFAQQRGSPERQSITQDEVINPFKTKDDIKPTVLTKQRSGEKKTLKPSKKSTIFQRSPGEKENVRTTVFAQQRGSPTEKQEVKQESPSRFKTLKPLGKKEKTISPKKEVVKNPFDRKSLLDVDSDKITFEAVQRSADDVQPAKRKFQSTRFKSQSPTRIETIRKTPGILKNIENRDRTIQLYSCNVGDSLVTEKGQKFVIREFEDEYAVCIMKNKRYYAVKGANANNWYIAFKDSFIRCKCQGEIINVEDIDPADI